MNYPKGFASVTRVEQPEQRVIAKTTLCLGDDGFLSDALSVEGHICQANGGDSIQGLSRRYLNGIDFLRLCRGIHLSL